jgi:cobalt-zinc-cadmium efflux system outer membrane protein
MRFSQKHKYTLLFLLLPLGSITAQTKAGSDAESLYTLSLNDALIRASERNPALLAQGYHERAASALIEQAGFSPNPTLAISLENFAGTGAIQGVQGLEATVQASQTIERGGKRDKRMALAVREHEAAAKAFAARRTEILAATATAFVQALAAQQRLALAEESLRLARETVTAADGRVQAGAASPAEAARARAGLAAAEAEFARAEAALNAARANLAATWGGTPEEAVSLDGVLRVPDMLPTREVAMTRLAAHPRLELQQTVLAGRRAALELERAQAVQDISVEGGLRFMREGSDVAFVAGVSIPFPVRNRNQGNIRAAREFLAGAEQGVRAVEVELRAEFTSVWQDLSAAHTAAQNLARLALPATAEAYQSVRHAYEQGQLPLIDVLDAQRALVAIRQEILDSEADYAVALARFDALTDPDYGSLSALISQP